MSTCWYCYAMTVAGGISERVPRKDLKRRIRCWIHLGNLSDFSGPHQLRMGQGSLPSGSGCAGWMG